MTLPVTRVTPYIPMFPYGGGAVGDAAIFVNGVNNASHNGKFSVVKTNGTITAFQITPPAGFEAVSCGGGVEHDGGVLVAFSGASASALWMAHIFPDGSVDAYPSGFSMVAGFTVKAGTKVWVFSQTDGYYPRVFNLTTMSWETTTPSAAVGATSEPVYLGGSIWMWYAGAWVKWNVSAATHANVSAPGVTGPFTGAQVAIGGAGGDAYWRAGSGTITKLTAAGASSTITMGVNFSQALCVDQDGYLRSTLSNGITAAGWHPDTLATYSESLGGTAGSGCQRNYLVGDVVIAGVWATS